MERLFESTPNRGMCQYWKNSPHSDYLLVPTHGAYDVGQKAARGAVFCIASATRGEGSYASE